MTAITHGPGPGLDAPMGGGAGGYDTTTATTITTLAIETVAQQAKRLSTLTARCASDGATFFRIENDHGQTVYIVSSWALNRELPDLDAVECWLDNVTGAQP
jgi:hypothetical protein